MTELTTVSQPYSDDEIDLRHLVRVLWGGKWLIGAITFVVAVIAIIVALLLQDIYRADALLAPNDEEGAGALSALAAQYGGLASLAGIDIGGDSSDKTATGLEVLKSRKFIADFIDRHDILIPLIAVDKWDSETGELLIDPDIYDESSKKWVREVSHPKKTIPSSQEAYEVFMDALTVSQDNKTGFIRLAVEHYSPLIAKQWLDWLIEDINSMIMREDVTEAQQTIDYLNQQISNTSLTELRQIFFNLIEEQTKTIILAAVTDEYLLKTLDPPVIPEEKARPIRSLIVIVATLFGGFLGVIIVLIRSSFSTKWRAAEVTD